LNDLEAIATAVPNLEPDELHTLREGKAVAGGTIAIIAPGTGLGEAFLTWDGSRYQAHASEGGHTNFAPTNALELDMLRSLLERHEHVSHERVCSGWGFPNIYAYLKDSGYADEPAWVAGQLAEADDATPIIISAALDDERSCELCSAALNMFVSILGSEAGNLALKVMATGGVYLGGGIPPRILSALTDETFTRTFTRKGRMSRVLDRIPVHVILNRRVALLGAASHGLDLYNSLRGDDS
jgi:glucokinase